MKRIFNILSILGLIVLFILSIIFTKSPLEWVDSLTFYSMGYPKFIIVWVGYCIIYLSIIWLVYYIINKTKDFFNKLNNKS